MEYANKDVFVAVSKAIQRFSSKDDSKRSPWATSMLAKLRRAVGTAPGSNPNVWEVTLSDIHGESRAEWAVHTALTLYALHQQGKPDCVSKNGIGFGEAARRIITIKDSSEQGVRRRFYALATATGLAEFSHHARGLVQLMKQNEIGFDYPRFAEDLYWYQFDASRDRIRMRWGRDFESHYNAKNENNEKQEGENTDE